MAKIKITSAEATREISKLINQVKALKKATTASGNSVKSLTTRLNNLKSKVTLSSAAIRKLDRAMKSQQKATRKLRSDVRALSKATNSNTTSTNANTVATKKQSVAKKSLIGNAKLLTKVFGIIAGLRIFSNILSDTFKLIKTFDSLKFTLEAISKSTLDVVNAETFLLDITRNYGVELVATTNRYLKFLAAAQQSGLALKDTEKIFRSMTKASASLGLATHEMEGVFLALEQMLSKGKVTTEELRRQLGERLPGAMGIMAAAVGVTTSELDVMLRKGKILSADVLPKFAEAVEIAYGIENVEKIDTLVAAQNRSVTAWQNFIKSVSDGDGYIKTSLKKILGYFEKFSNSLTYLFGGINPKIRDEISSVEKYISINLKNRAKENVNLKQSEYNKIENIQKRFNKAELAFLTESDTKKRKKLREQLNFILNEKIKYNNKLKVEEKRLAKIDYGDALTEYKKQNEKYEPLKKKLESLKKELSDNQTLFPGINLFLNNKLKADIKNTEKELSNIVDKYTKAVGEFNVLRKILQESDSIAGAKIYNNGTGKVVKKVINAPNDLSNDIKIKILENSIRLNKLLLKSDETYISDKKDLLLDINKFEIEIAKLNFDKTKKAAEDKYDKDLKSLELALNKKQITEEEFYNQSLLLYNEQAQKIELADLKYNKKIQDSRENLGKNLIKIVSETNKNIIDKIKDKYNIEIIALNDLYNKSEKTQKDLKKLEKGKRDIAIKMANEIIDAQIKILEAQLKIKNQSQEHIDKIIESINELKASKKTLNGTNDKDILSWQDWLEKIGEIINEAGNLIDAIYERRIENINAVIDAETKKYDKLIELAKNDNVEQESLRKQKNDRINILENKRLKEEQKRAKARKAFAIADIIINTAVGITNALKTGNVPLSILIGVLGALQVATVIAQPIPQYKHGLIKADKDHVAMINDGNEKEYVERNGKILTTNTKNAIVKLKKNDRVYKNYDDMVNNSLLYSILKNNGIKTNNNNSSEMLNIELAIEKGFKKAKIENNINILNNNNYVNEKSMWS